MRNMIISLNDAELAALSHEVRKSVFEICLNANNGHIGGCAGAVELLVVLYFWGILRYGNEIPPNIERDRLAERRDL